jgi:hypothetical protein
MSSIIKETDKKIPCIFGPKIHKDCPVRRELKKPEDISKWIKKSLTEPDINKIMDKLAKTIADAIETEFTTLSSFCSCCPFLAKINEPN